MTPDEKTEFDRVVYERQGALAEVGRLGHELAKAQREVDRLRERYESRPTSPHNPYSHID